MTHRIPLKNRKDYNPFHIITGGQGVGKTKLSMELMKRGLKVIPDMAGQIIGEQQEIEGQALPWKDKKLFMKLLFQRSVENFEKTLIMHGNDTPVIFDGGFLDALCFGALHGLHIEQDMKNLVEDYRYNPNVLILPPSKMDDQTEKDWNEAVFIHNKMIQTYRSYQYDLIEVPKAPIEERADFVFKFLKKRP